MIKQKKLIGLALGALIIILAVSFYFVWSRGINNEKVENSLNTEEEQLKNDNKDIIEDNKQPLNQLRSIDETDNVWGDRNAPVQMIVYSDFECPFCARFVETIDKAKKEFDGKIAIAFRHFPLNLHPEAMPAALAAECAGEQGKFWEMHDKLFKDNMSGSLNAVQYKENAKEIGLDVAKFNQCFDTDKYKEKVFNQMIEGKNLGISGTPTSFINGEILPGAYPFEDFKDSEGRDIKGVKSTIEKFLK